MAYQSQILDVSNQTKWGKKVPQGGVYFDPGTKSYFFRNADGRIQRTANLETAYTAAGIQQGTASDVVVAANQNFNLGGAQVQYDPKSQSYYFKDPKTGQMLTTSNLATAYGVINPKITTSGGVSYDPRTTSVLQNTGEQVSLVNTSGTGTNTIVGTPESGFRPTATSAQFFQPVYQPTYKNYAREGYSLMGDQSGLGALQAVLKQNTAGSLGALRGIGSVANPFSINPMNYRTAYQTAMSQAQPNYGGFGVYGGVGQMNSPFSGYAQPMQQIAQQPTQQSVGVGNMGGIGTLATPFK